MRTYITRKWEFRTYSVQGKCKCSECGKQITKTFSFQTREDVLTNKEDWDRIEKEKQAWEAESHVCTACKRKKIVQERKEITELPEIKSLIEKERSMQEFETKVKEEMRPLIRSLREKLNDRVVLVDNKEYVIHSVRTDHINGNAFEIMCYGIDKNKPWHTNNKDLYIIDNDYWCNYSKGGNRINVLNVTFTDEIFSKRKELL